MKHLGRMILAALSGLLWFSLVGGLVILYAARTFDGICPAEPPDLPAHPCARSDYLGQITYTGWALFTWVIAFVFWELLCVVVWSAWVGFRRPRASAPITPRARNVHRGLAIACGVLAFSCFGPQVFMVAMMLLAEVVGKVFAHAH